MKRRERLLLVGAAVALALIALYLFMVQPQLQDVRLARREVDRKQAELARTAALVQQRGDIERQHAVAQRALEELLDRVPPDPGLPALLTQVDLALRASGLQLVEITFPQEATEGSTQAPGAGTVGALTFQMQVRGRYPQLLSFVQIMETLPRAVVIDTLAIAGGESGTQVSLSVRVFYLR